MHPQTIGIELERQRLRHREQRMERVLSALHDRAVYRHAVSGETPRPLRQAIAEFGRELNHVRRRLAEVSAA
jgi:hypothetical protein